MMILLLLLLCFHIIIDCKVVQVFAFSRHCDRTSLTENRYSFEESESVKKVLGLPLMTLTPLGENQCHEMGKMIRERYLNKESENYIDGIDDQWNPFHYHFQSSSSGRTLRSVSSVTYALFEENGHKMPCKGNDHSLPHASQSVPIYSINERNDRIIKEYDICPSVKTKSKNALRNLQKSDPHTIERLSHFSQLLRWPFDSTDAFYYFYDRLNTLYYHHLTSDSTSDLIKDHFEDMTLFMNEIWRTKFDVNHIQPLAGGGFATKMRNEMQTFQSWRSMNSDTRKYFHFSGHDSGLSVILSSMFLSKDYPDELGGLPPYGSALFFELHKKDDNKFYVKFLFKKGFDGVFQSYPMKSIEGCEENDECPFEFFSKFVTNQLDVSIEDWCHQCDNTNHEKCLKTYLDSTKEELKTSLEFFQNEETELKNNLTSTWRHFILAERSVQSLTRQYEKMNSDFQEIHLKKKELEEELRTSNNEKRKQQQQLQLLNDRIEILQNQQQQNEENQSKSSLFLSILGILSIFLVILVGLASSTMLGSLVGNVYLYRMTKKLKLYQKIQNGIQIEFSSSEDEEENADMITNN